VEKNIRKHKSNKNRKTQIINKEIRVRKMAEKERNQEKVKEEAIKKNLNRKPNSNNLIIQNHN
jgi:hypothetical protein